MTIQKVNMFNQSYEIRQSIRDTLWDFIPIGKKELARQIVKNMFTEGMHRTISQYIFGCFKVRL